MRMSNGYYKHNVGLKRSGSFYKTNIFIVTNGDFMKKVLIATWALRDR